LLWNSCWGVPLRSALVSLLLSRRAFWAFGMIKDVSFCCWSFLVGCDDFPLPCAWLSFPQFSWATC
jgi:hypothetical protein